MKPHAETNHGNVLTWPAALLAGLFLLACAQQGGHPVAEEQTARIAAVNDGAGEEGPADAAPSTAQGQQILAEEAAGTGSREAEAGPMVETAPAFAAESETPPLVANAGEDAAPPTPEPVEPEAPQQAAQPVDESAGETPAEPLPPEPLAEPEPAVAQPEPAPTPDVPPPEETLDMEDLEKRLRSTRAIGLFTKLELKSQVNDLVQDFAAYHDNRSRLTLEQLEERFELLVMKLMLLLQDDDPALHHDIALARPALWTTLSDAERFASVRGP